MPGLELPNFWLTSGLPEHRHKDSKILNLTLTSGYKQALVVVMILYEPTRYAYMEFLV
ncbi:hypothetical protein D3C86_816910 [compost metagenome]